MDLSPRISVEALRSTVEAALATHGASPANAAAIGRSLVAAELEGSAVGLAHLPDYCDALAAGRLDGAAEPVIEQIGASLIRVDARGGAPHLGADRAWAELVAAAAETGVVALAVRNGFTCGALGYFARRLAADHGLTALVAANAAPPVKHALIAAPTHILEGLF